MPSGLNYEYIEYIPQISNQRVSSKEKQVMGDIITSSVRGEQPSQLSSIIPPHSTSRLQPMPPTQNSSSSTSLVQMTAIICAIEQFLPKIVAPVARIEWLV
jgi:hypothetical protein